jgi:glycosyltransferase involved in cell wall biosynthesis
VTTPEIAVVVPAHDAGATLAAALAGVVAQSIQPREVVVVDDGSSDDTVTVARRFEPVLPLAVVTHDVARGPGAARNAGASASSAPLLAFLDADDVWLPDHLEVLSALQQEAGGVIAGRGLRWYPAAGLIEGSRSDARVVPPGDAALPWIIRHHTFGMHAVVPRDVFDHVGGFATELDGVEDWDLWIRVAAAGVPMQRSATYTFLYRQHDGNLSRQMERHCHAARRLHDRLAVEYADDPAVAAALRHSRAMVSFAEAAACLDAGDFDGARRLAAGARGGSLPLALRSALLGRAPRIYASVRRGRSRAASRAPSATARVDAP